MLCSLVSQPQCGVQHVPALSLVCRLQARFLFPVLPVFNVAAACAVARLLHTCRSPAARLGLAATLAMLALASACASALMLLVSRCAMCSSDACIESVAGCSAQVDGLLW